MPFSAAEAAASATAPACSSMPTTSVAPPPRERERDPADAAVGVDDAFARADRQRARDRGVRQRGDVAVGLEEDARREPQPDVAAADVHAILDRRLRRSSTRSSFAAAAKIALPRPRLTCSTTPITSGRAARNARASAGPFGERARRHPCRQHPAVVTRAQHDVAQIADQRPLVVGGDARLIEQRRQRGRGVVQRRLGDAAPAVSTTSCERGA